MAVGKCPPSKSKSKSADLSMEAYTDLLAGAARGVGPATWEKQAFDNSGEAPQTKGIKTPTHFKGIHCDKLKEPVPKHPKAPCEKVIAGLNNTSIIFGRDRPADKTSGYGGRGDSQAGMIDICVGRQGKRPLETNLKKAPFQAHPNFFDDAARIYISQKADIDCYFGLTSPDMSSPLNYDSSEAKSAIALKADAIRVIGREGVKIISSMDPDNSHGYVKRGIFGVELICAAAERGVKGATQPLAKSYSLAKALERIVDHISSLNGIMDSFLMTQLNYNTAVQTHTHISPFFGMLVDAGVGSPSLMLPGIVTMINNIVKQKASLYAHKVELGGYSLNYCQSLGDGWFGSKYHKCN